MLLILGSIFYYNFLYLIKNSKIRKEVRKCGSLLRKDRERDLDMV